MEYQLHEVEYQLHEYVVTEFRPGSGVLAWRRYRQVSGPTDECEQFDGNAILRDGVLYLRPHNTSQAALKTWGEVESEAAGRQAWDETETFEDPDGITRYCDDGQQLEAVNLQIKNVEARLLHAYQSHCAEQGTSDRESIIAHMIATVGWRDSSSG